MISGFSSDELAIIEYFVKNSDYATDRELRVCVSKIAEELSLDKDSVEVAVANVDSCYLVEQRSTEAHTVAARDELYVTFDSEWKEWNPIDDAKRLAGDLYADAQFPKDSEKICERYNWTARQLNPALTYLYSKGVLDKSRRTGNGKWVSSRITLVPTELRSFVNSYLQH